MSITRKFISLLAILLSLAVLAHATEVDDDWAAQEEQADNVQTADLIWGYLAADGAVLNPFYCTERDLISVNQLVFESVIGLDDQQKPVPLLADNWSVDGTTWTFNLRSDIQFHNGIALTAEDVVMSYNMFLQTDAENPYSGRLSLIESMMSLDLYTLQVEARYTGIITLYAMTFPVVQRSTANDTIARGTGPYWIISYNQGQSIRLERNPLWWKEQPEIESIQLIRYATTGDALEALQTGEIDCFSTRSNAASLSRKLSSLIATDYSTNTYELLVPNISEGSVLSDINVRMAVMYAIDRATIASNAYGEMLQQSEVPIIPGTWLYESQSAMYYHSPERALLLLQEAGWDYLTDYGTLSKLENGMLVDLEITIVTYNDSNSTVRKTAAEQIALNLEAVGIQANVTTLSASSAASRVRDNNFDLALIGVNLSEVPNLRPLLSQNGELNFSGAHSSEMDELLNRTLTATTEDEFVQVYSEIQMYIVENLPIMGLGFRTGTVLSTRSLAGLSGMREYDVLNGLEFVEK